MPNHTYTHASLRNAVGVIHREVSYNGIIIMANLKWHIEIGKAICEALYEHCMNMPVNCMANTSCRRCLVNKLKRMMAECVESEEVKGE